MFEREHFTLNWPELLLENPVGEGQVELVLVECIRMLKGGVYKLQTLIYHNRCTRDHIL